MLSYLTLPLWYLRVLSVCFWLDLTDPIRQLPKGGSLDSFNPRGNSGTSPL